MVTLFAILLLFPAKTKARPGLALVTEADYLEVLLNMLDQATKSIELMAFSFAAGGADGQLYFKGLPFKIMEKLKQLKKSKKLKVRVFLEGKRDTAERNKVTATHLKKAGIQVRLGSTHAKAVCVDGRYLLMGSTNLTDQSLTKNFETNVLVDHKATAKEFLKYFEHYWKGGRHGGVKLRKPLLADGDFKDQIVDQIGKAKKSLDFSIYFFFQDDLEAALIDAHKRGVKIKGLIHHHWSFGRADVKRTEACVSRLREAGLKNLAYAPARMFNHSKYVVIDGKSTFVGSGNWIDRDVTTHPQLYLNLLHPSLSKALAKHLKDQIASLR